MPKRTRCLPACSHRPPQEELLAADLAAALAQAHAAGRYGELLLVADTCQASTLYSRLAAPNVLAVASSKLGARGGTGCGTTAHSCCSPAAGRRPRLDAARRSLALPRAAPQARARTLTAWIPTWACTWRTR